MLSFDHKFLLSPGIWLGEGRISFSYSQEEFPYFTKWIVEEREGKSVLCKQLVEIKGLSHKMENHFQMVFEQSGIFAVAMKNDSVSKAVGKGTVEKMRLFWEFCEGPLEGKEVYTKESEEQYSVVAEYSAQGVNESFRTFIKGVIWLKNS